MENTKQTPQEKSTLSNILEQIKIVLVIYGIVIIIHMVSIGSKLPDLAKSTVVSFVMVVIAITLKNFVKKPNLPGFAWATLVSFVLTLPISPIQRLKTSVNPTANIRNNSTDMWKLFKRCCRTSAKVYHFKFFLHLSFLLKNFLSLNI